MKSEVHVVARAAQHLDGADRRERVEPAPDAAAPDEYAVVRVDTRPGRCGRGRGSRIVRDPEGHHVDQRAPARVAAIAGRVEQAPEDHPAEPEVALPLARADHEVGGGQAGEHAERRDPLRPPCLGERLGAGGLEHLDRQRVVEVEDDADRRAGEPPQQLAGQALHDDDVVARGRSGEGVVVAHAGLEQIQASHLGLGLGRLGGGPCGAGIWQSGRARAGQVARAGSGERHLALPRERSRQLVCPDRRPGHRLPHWLRRDDQHPRPSAHAATVALPSRRL